MHVIGILSCILPEIVDATLPSTEDAVTIEDVTKDAITLDDAVETIYVIKLIHCILRVSHT